MQIREDAAVFKLSDSYLVGCRWDAMQVWLVSLELCNHCSEILVLLTIESVDLFQDRYTFLPFEFTNFEIFRNNSVCKNDMQC